MNKGKSAVIGFIIIILLLVILAVIVGYMPMPEKVSKPKYDQRSLSDILVPKREKTFEQKRKELLRKEVEKMDKRLFGE